MQSSSQIITANKAIPNFLQAKALKHVGRERKYEKRIQCSDCCPCFDSVGWVSRKISDVELVDTFDVLPVGIACL